MANRRYTIRKTLGGAKKTLGGLKKAAVAGAAAATLVAGKAAGTVRDVLFGLGRGADARENRNKKEVVEMKKSTFVALLVGLAAVAGVLAALYMYVLRREKELDEYEQLLFSEDFNDDIPDDMEEPEAAPAKS